MDLQRLLDQLNRALDRSWQATLAYFSDLSQRELYGWSAFCCGFLLFVAGLILL